MKRVLFLLSFICNACVIAQIKVLNTGTTEPLLSIAKKDGKIFISGNRAYLSSCVGNCDTVAQLTTPTFVNSSFRFNTTFVNSSTCFLTANSFQNNNLAIWKTTNGAQTWTKKFDTTSTSLYSGYTAIFDSTSGILIGTTQNTIRSNNSFQSLTFGIGAFNYPSCIASFGDSTVIAGGCNISCGLSISKNRGVNWTNTGPQNGIGYYPPLDIAFLSKDTIFAITEPGQQSVVFMRTFDGGASYWKDFIFEGEPYGSAPKEAFTKIYAKNRNEIFLFARDGLTSNGYLGNGIIYKSRNLGDSWERYVTPFKASLYDMTFINDTLALISGSNGLLFKWEISKSNFTDVLEYASKQVMKIRPCPAGEFIEIEFPIDLSGERVDVSVFNSGGKQVFHSSTFLEKINISELPNGLYYFRLVTQNRIEKQLFIKE